RRGPAMPDPTPLPPAEAGHRSEERFRALVEKGSDVIVLVDADYVIRYATPAAETVTGYGPDALIGRACLDFDHPDDAAAKRAALDECVRHPNRAVPLRCRSRHADGSWRAYEGVARNRLADPAVGAV